MSVSTNTRKTYEVGFTAFKRFWIMSGHSIDHVLSAITEDIVLRFITHCHDVLKLKSATIKLYLSAIKFHSIVNSHNNIFVHENKLIRAETLLKGIKKSEISITRTRLPLTSHIVRDMVLLLRKGFFSSYLNKLMEAACVVAFIGFLRCGEFTVLNKFSPDTNLCCEDILILEDRAVLKLRASKTDVFRKGVNIQLFKTESVLCPVYALEQYINTRSPLRSGQPFFITFNGEALSRSVFLSSLKSLLRALGFNPDLFNGHSFRIGAATSASAKVEDHMIQTLGRWTSLCYTRYIRTPLDNIKQAQKAMIQT